MCEWEHIYVYIYIHISKYIHSYTHAVDVTGEFDSEMRKTSMIFLSFLSLGAC